MIRVLPIDFKAEGGELVPADAGLHGAVEAFCRAEFGAEKDFSKYAKAWAVIEESDGALKKVWGVTGLITRLDMPTFHVGRPENTDQYSRCLQARDALIERVRGYIEDQGGKGATVFVFVAPAAERYWARFLRALGAEPAHRYQVQI